MSISSFSCVSIIQYIQGHNRCDVRNTRFQRNDGYSVISSVGIVFVIKDHPNFLSQVQMLRYMLTESFVIIRNVVCVMSKFPTIMYTMQYMRTTFWREILCRRHIWRIELCHTSNVSAAHVRAPNRRFLIFIAPFTVIYRCYSQCAITQTSLL